MNAHWGRKKCAQKMSARTVLQNMISSIGEKNERK